MAEKRKDNKGRILHTGESQRSNGSYMYRYTDINGKRKYIYDKDLNSLRDQIKKIEKDLQDGIDFEAGNMTVLELLEKYLNQKRNLKKQTKTAYEQILSNIKKYKIANRKVKDIKTSDAKEFYISLHDSGLSKGTISNYRNILRPAFAMAVEDELIRKNPFDTNLSFIQSDAVTKIALTETQEHQFLKFIEEHKTLKKYYDIDVILFETGLRVGEMVGITTDCIDLKNRTLKIKQQICMGFHGDPFISDTKTKSGEREIYISDKAYQSFVNLLQRRKSFPEKIIDGRGKFLLLSDTNCGIIPASTIRYHLKTASAKIKMKYPDFPEVTPHICRHTFCTRMIDKGIDPKTLQYIMGHANVSITLDRYTHKSNEKALETMRIITASG